MALPSGYRAAVNAKSFCNYVVSKCTYFNGNALSAANKTQLYSYLIEGITEGRLINVATGLAILNRLYRLMTGGSEKTITVTDGTLSSPLNVNSARQLLDVVLPASSGLRAKFCTLDHIYDATGNFNSYNYMEWTFCMPAPSTGYNGKKLLGTLHGGGGGGSGAIAGDGDKNASYYIRSGRGGRGLPSYIKRAGTTLVTASGGELGDRVAQQAGGNPQIAQSGNQGANGAAVSVDITIERLVDYTITPGAGGGGGGGVGVTAGGATGGASCYGGDGGGYSAGTPAGGYGNAPYNEWAGQDHAFGGGGGGGGPDYAGGSSDYKGPWSGAVTVVQNGLAASGGVGGLGGCTNRGNSPQPTAIGRGGLAGPVYFGLDEYAVANGGNGGNSGGFVKTAGCTASTVLFIWRQ